MKLKQVIMGLLEQRQATFRELARYLHLKEKDLEMALDMNPPEMRLLESIAKLLQVPLYGLLPENGGLGGPTARDLRPPLIEHEIRTLRQLLKEKEGMLKEMKS